MSAVFQGTLFRSGGSPLFDLDSEDAATREIYGLNDKLMADFGRKCLITRKLIEKGAEVPFTSAIIHTTIRHLTGINHKRLSYLHQGLKQRLTGVIDLRVVTKALV
jgi:hypothetical protein